MVAGIVFTLGLLNHNVEVFLHPLHPQLGVEQLLRAFHSGPVHSYQDLPKAGEGFDTIVYADWYPVGTPRAGGESKLQGASPGPPESGRLHSLDAVGCGAMPALYLGITLLWTSRLVLCPGVSGIRGLPACGCADLAAAPSAACL